MTQNELNNEPAMTVGDDVERPVHPLPNSLPPVRAPQPPGQREGRHARGAARQDLAAAVRRRQPLRKGRGLAAGLAVGAGKSVGEPFRTDPAVSEEEDGFRRVRLPLQGVP